MSVGGGRGAGHFHRHEASMAAVAACSNQKPHARAPEPALSLSGWLDGAAALTEPKFANAQMDRVLDNACCHARLLASSLSLHAGRHDMLCEGWDAWIPYLTHIIWIYANIG